MRWWSLLSRAAGLGTEGHADASAGPMLARTRAGWFRTAADVRALELLREHLTPEQQKRFEAYGCFDVIGSSSHKRYRIRIGTVFNVDEYGADGQYSRSWCFGPVGSLPIGDVLLAQKLSLENFEVEALSVANTAVRMYA